MSFLANIGEVIDGELRVKLIVVEKNDSVVVCTERSVKCLRLRVMHAHVGSEPV